MLHKHYALWLQVPSLLISSIALVHLNSTSQRSLVNKEQSSRLYCFLCLIFPSLIFPREQSNTTYFFISNTYKPTKTLNYYRVVLLLLENKPQLLLQDGSGSGSTHSVELLVHSVLLNKYLTNQYTFLFYKDRENMSCVPTDVKPQLWNPTGDLTSRERIFLVVRSHLTTIQDNS